MADQEKETVPEGMVSTEEGVQTNHEVGKQTKDQFYDGDAQRPENQPSDPKHATKGMTTFGYSEASRIENTAELQEQERKAYEKAQAKKEKD